MIENYVAMLRRLSPGESVHVVAAQLAVSRHLERRRPAARLLLHPPLRLAHRTRPHGSHRRAPPALSVERL